MNQLFNLFNGLLIIYFQEKDFRIAKAQIYVPTYKRGKKRAH